MNRLPVEFSSRSLPDLPEKLRSRLFVLLARVDQSTLIGSAILRHLRDGFDLEPLVDLIREMGHDNPDAIVSIIGQEAAKILGILKGFKRNQLKPDNKL